MQYSQFKHTPVNIILEYRVGHFGRSSRTSAAAMQPGTSAARKKPRRPPGLTGLSLAGLAPASSFVLTDTGTFAKVDGRVGIVLQLHAWRSPRAKSCV